MEKLKLYIESLIFASEKAITFDEIKVSVENYLGQIVGSNIIINSIYSLIDKYSDDSYSFNIIEISNGYLFATKPEFNDIISDYLKISSRTKLSKSSLETLAIIAYNQPVTKPEIERVRGVNSDYAIKKLLIKEIIEINGREDGPGKPLLYATNDKFLNYMGIKNLKELPSLKEFKEISDGAISLSEEE
ncbi:MAG: SMC-Scp complex subunit ScpB [Saprospiraceae bacterium]